MLYYKDLSEVVVKGEGVIDLVFAKNSITLEVTCKGGSPDRDKLLEHLRDYSLDGKTWLHNYDATPKQAFQHLMHACHIGTIGAKIHAFLEIFVDVLLSSTLFWCDVKDIRKEGLWPVLFCCSMAWLAAFSFLMVQVMNLISENIPFLTTLLLGVTLGAIGTSLPNAMASIIMATQGKSAAAIGNAFGSNVQNVFLAMGAPWIIYILSSGNTVPMEAPAPPGKHGQSISEGVGWMLITLILVVFFALMPQCCSFNKFAGYCFVTIYAGYLLWTVFEFEFWST